MSKLLNPLLYFIPSNKSNTVLQNPMKIHIGNKGVVMTQLTLLIYWQMKHLHI